MKKRVSSTLGKNIGIRQNFGCKKVGCCNFFRNLFHGNVVNETKNTRMSINCRFKICSVQMVRSQALIEVEYFISYSLRAITKLGREYMVGIFILRYKGYVSSREFGGMKMPVPAQNSCLREFVATETDVHPAHLESGFENCFHQLFGLILDLKPGVQFSCIQLQCCHQDKN